ncbi:hypothetical protein ES703_75669 [subsurface metagenome]
MRGMRGQPTFGRPSSLQKPATFARSSDEQEILREYGLATWKQRRIPPAWPTVRTWAPGAIIANLPSVIQTGAGVSGPSRTMLPQLRRQTKKIDASGSSGDSIVALDCHMQAQPSQVEQPLGGASVSFGDRGEVAEVYFGKFLGQMIRARAQRVTSSRPTTPHATWTPGHREDTESVAVDSGALEMARRRREIDPLAPPIMPQMVLPILSELRTRLRGR